jgi:non-reducing end alpha-L-arabinofuranosidase
MKHSVMFKRFDVLLAAVISISMAQQKNTMAATGPGDIYTAAGNTVVAAHSTVRALFSSYNGPLYQVRRQSDNKTLDIGVLSPGGFADGAAQDAFCSGTKCVITAVYDQSGKGNDMWYQGSTQVPGSNVSIPATATKEQFKISGHTVYSLYIDPNVCYWHDGSKSGIPTGSQPEGMYMVTSGKHYNNGCCFDYGNSETDRNPDGAGTMDAINFSNQCWFGTANIQGPWVQADLEWGVFSGGSQSWNTNQKSFPYQYVTAMLKNNGTTEFALRGANAEYAKSDTLYTNYKGKLPSGWSPMKKMGAITLGCGGDCCKPGGGANMSAGTFYEGAIVSGYPTDATENLIQANIVAAGYGSNTPVNISNRSDNAQQESLVKVRYNPSNAGAVIGYTLQHAQRVSVTIIEQRGRRIAAVADGIFPAGRYEAVWDAKRVPAGVYVCRVAMDGMEGWTGRIVIGK